MTAAALEIVSKVWCHPTTENMNPNIVFSRLMAEKVDEMLELLREAERELKWAQSSPQWLEKYEQWCAANRIDSEATQEIVLIPREAPHSE